MFKHLPLISIGSIDIYTEKERQRYREKDRERHRQRKRERNKEKDGGKDRQRERQRKRDNQISGIKAYKDVAFYSELLQLVGCERERESQ